MSDVFTLTLTVTEYDECAGLLDKRMKKNGNIEVPRKLFKKLFTDHEEMYSGGNYTESTEHDECKELIDGLKGRKKLMEVPRALFSKLVLDHQTMYSELCDRNATIVERKS